MAKPKKPAPKGFKWICTPQRKVRGKSQKVLYAKDYGYEAWCFLVRAYSLNLFKTNLNAL